MEGRREGGRAVKQNTDFCSASVCVCVQVHSPSRNPLRKQRRRIRNSGKIKQNNIFVTLLVRHYCLSGGKTTHKLTLKLTRGAACTHTPRTTECRPLHASGAPPFLSVFDTCYTPASSRYFIFFPLLCLSGEGH